MIASSMVTASQHPPIRFSTQHAASIPIYGVQFSLAWVVMLSALLGCVKSSLPGPTGTVSGMATYQNKPIPEGSAIVFVHNQTGIIGTGVTSAAGEFQIRMRDGSQVLVGEYTVNVRPPGEPDPNIMKLTPENVPPAWKLVPQRYWMSNTSAEAFTVKEGHNTYQLELRD
jgi:hypothetical protein